MNIPVEILSESAYSLSHEGKKITAHPDQKGNGLMTVWLEDKTSGQRQGSFGIHPDHVGAIKKEMLAGGVHRAIDYINSLKSAKIAHLPKDGKTNESRIDEVSDKTIKGYINAVAYHGVTKDQRRVGLNRAIDRLSTPSYTDDHRSHDEYCLDMKHDHFRRGNRLSRIDTLGLPSGIQDAKDRAIASHDNAQRMWLSARHVETGDYAHRYNVRKMSDATDARSRALGDESTFYDLMKRHAPRRLQEARLDEITVGLAMNGFETARRNNANKMGKKRHDPSKFLKYADKKRKQQNTSPKSNVGSIENMIDASINPFAHIKNEYLDESMQLTNSQKELYKKYVEALMHDLPTLVKKLGSKQKAIEAIKKEAIKLAMGKGEK